MIETRHIHPDDLSLHAMRLLPAAEAAEIHAHVLQCAECSRAFQDAQRDLTIVALTVPLEAPRSQSRERFMEQVAREKRLVALDEPLRQTREEPAPVAASALIPPVATIDAPRRQRTGSTVLPWLGWALAAGTTFFAVSEYHQRTQLQTTVADQAIQLRSETTQMAALSAEAVKARALMENLTGSEAQRVSLVTTPTAKALPQGRASYVAAKGTLVFIASNLQPLPLEKVYELWIIPADGSAPVPAGTFAPDARGNANLVMPDIPKGIEAKAFGVTLEAEGGAVKPTLPILLVGSGA